MEYINEKYKNDELNSISLKGIEIILEQMKNQVCKICIDKNIKGTGFFCKIPFKKSLLPVLITTNNIIDESIFKKEKILLSINNNLKEIKLDLDNRKKYTNKEKNITIIEIKEKDKIEIIMEIDNNKRNNKSYRGESIYILHYPRKKNIHISYAIIKEEKDNNFFYQNYLEKDSYGSPILNLSNNKIIGMHIEENNVKNCNVGLFLKFGINDFIKNCEYDKNKKLFEFNEKYNLDIEDLDIKKLDLNWKVIENEGLKNLCDIDFKELKELDLNYNNISNIKILEKAKFNKLEKLFLNGNNISKNINQLGRLDFKELKELDLSNNKIADIQVLEKVKFKKLEKLVLNTNEIGNNINILDKVDFKELKCLILYENNISDIKVLQKVNFEKLEILDLGWNKITNINILGKVNFKKLKTLDLNYNIISDIRILEKVNFEKLEKLYLNKNKISNINILEKVNFKQLNELNLSDNNISDIKVLKKVKFEKLEKLYLKKNKIQNINILKNVKFNELKELYFSNNNISDIKVLEIVNFTKLEKIYLDGNKIDENKFSSIINHTKFICKI